jgi:hypothetical protein
MERCAASTVGLSRRFDTRTRLHLPNGDLTLASEITEYAAELRGLLTNVGADLTALNNLTVAAAKLGGLADGLSGPVTSAAWDTARAQWQAARNAFNEQLSEALLGPLAAVPGLADLAGDVGKFAEEGVHGGIDLGPVRLEVNSALLVIQPPTFVGSTVPPPAIAIGPYEVGEIAASLASPFGGGSGLPGGGSLVRLPRDGGFGGTLELPLGPVQISAAAVIAVRDGQTSFLGILGAMFLPPIQLSFGFSLDRVGGIIGVNRRADSEALRAAVRTGSSGDVLFAVRPPPSPLALVAAADHLFPFNHGTHLIGPSLKLAWLSFGSAGSLIGLDLAVIVEIPTGKVAVLGVARASIPGLPFVLNLRLDVLGLLDPVEQMVSIDASLVDSHVLGIFEVYGDAAFRFSWGTVGYLVATVGGFYPGFNPEPAHLPALRRVGLALDSPIPIIEVRAEGYFAVTSNSIQFGGRWEIGISLGIEAHGFLQVDAIVQFRPFHFEARVAAGFDVSAGGFSFASVTLEGSIAGPGPIVIHGSLSIDVFLFSISWSETFTLGSGPSDTLPTPPSLLDVMVEEMNKVENVHTASIGDPHVVLAPRPTAGPLAAVPPTGTLQVAQRRAPLGLLIERVDGRPLAGPQGVKVTSGNSDVTERFSPGTYINLSQAEALNRPPFDLLAAGRVLSLADPALSESMILDSREVSQIVIKDHVVVDDFDDGKSSNLLAMVELVSGARKPPALSDVTPLVTATQETWQATSAPGTFSSATAAHQFVRYHAGIAQASADAAAPLNLAGV